MKIKITVTYRDDKKESWIANDFSRIEGWVHIYQDNKRTVIPSEGVKRIEQEVIKF